MEYRTYKFSLQDLKVSLKDVRSFFGRQIDIPNLFLDTFYKEIESFNDVSEIMGGTTLRPCLVRQDCDTVTIDRVKFHTGGRISGFLRNASMMTIFICTAGETIANRSRQLMSKGELLEGYVVDTIGSVVVEKAMDRIQDSIREEFSQKNLGITNRYSPGYCEWDVAEQRKLFSFFPENFCGVGLTNSCLMTPIKSISGFIGVGETTQYHRYSCEECKNSHCIYRGKR